MMQGPCTDGIGGLMAARLQAKPEALAARQGKVHNADAEAAKDLLLWARRERFAISQVTVGDVVLAGVYDHAPRFETSKDADPQQPARKSIIEEYAGPMMAGPTPEQAEQADEIEPTEDDEDDG